MNSSRIAIGSLTVVILIFISVLILSSKEMARVKISGEQFLHGKSNPPGYIALRAFRTNEGEIGEFGPEKSAFKVSLVRATVSPEAKTGPGSVIITSPSELLGALRADYKKKNPESPLAPLLSSYLNAQIDSRRMGLGEPRVLQVVASNGTAYVVELAPFEGARRQKGLLGLLQKPGQQLLVFVSGEVPESEVSGLLQMIGAAVI